MERNRVIIPSRRVLVVAVVFAVLFITMTEGVFAATVIESTGPGGYGWQQVYTDVSPFVRLTGSADRQYYDWGYKTITITGRIENYWATDCGWWYVSDPAEIQNITIWDNATDIVYSFTSAQTAQKGLVNITYPWGADDDPGDWTVNVTNSSAVEASFKIHVRGQLNVTSITSSQSGDTINVYATIKDNAGNPVTSGIAVTMYVSGPGYTGSSAMTYSTQWDGSFTSTTPGDHYITVKATDYHQNYIDGRGSNKTAVTGAFPYTFGGFSGSGSIIKAVIMIFLALLLLRSGRKAAFLCSLIFMGGRL